jgi:cytochrome c553
LKSTTDEDRFRSVKQGHVGTAMFPKKLMSDDDIRDLVAYLGVLRKGGGDNPHSIP